MNCYLNISNKGVQPQKKFFRRSWQVSHKINHKLKIVRKTDNPFRPKER